MSRPRSALALLLGAALAPCAASCTTDLGECDPDAARAPIYYDENGYPAYPGQALLEVSCGAGAFCHASGIPTEDRLGAPLGIELDVGVAAEEGELARLAHAHAVVRSMRGAIYEQVVSGSMPPPPPAGDTARSAAPRYRTQPGTPDEHELPAIETPEGRAILRNWLACGAPVVEAVEGASTGIGDVVARAHVCPEGEASCGGACIDVTSDPANCGGCGIACGPDQRCADGRCECVVSLDACGAACVELSSDPMHCGACDNACAALCAMGRCVDRCPAGTTECDGACADLSSSAAHCGACDRPCAPGEACTEGACSCAEGYERCGGACVDLASDEAHCGACDRPCSEGASCVDGACTCPAGTTSCGGECVELASDPRHCGACGNACADGASCAGGTCVSCGPEVSFAADIQPIFTRSCAVSRCHSGARPQASLSLEAGRAWAELVNVPASCGGHILVVPGSEADSYLMNKLLGVGMCSGSQMPKRDEALPAAEIELVRAWICRGAAND